MKDILIMAGSCIAIIAFVGAALSPWIVENIDKKFSTDNERESTFKQIMVDHKIMLRAHHDDTMFLEGMQEISKSVNSMRIRNLQIHILKLKERKENDYKLWNKDDEIQLMNSVRGLRALLEENTVFTKQRTPKPGPVYPRQDEDNE